MAFIFGGGCGRLKFIIAVILGNMLVSAAAMASPVSVFDISQPTHAIVDNKTAVYPGGSPDTSNTFHTGYIYNIFGAANNGIEGSGDMLFADNLQPNFVDFHTAEPIN